MRKLLLGSVLLWGLLAFGQSFPIEHGSIDESSAAPDPRGAILFDSFTNRVDSPAFAVISQNFTDVGIDFQTYGADDFTIPDCGWEINRFVAFGNYSNTLDPMSLGPASSVNVYVLAKTGALPTSTNVAGSAIYALENASYTELDLVNGGDFSIDLPAPLVLPAGDYWLIVQANMDFLVGGQWNWTESSLTMNSGTVEGDESAWFQTDAIVQNPQTMVATCVNTWGARVTTCGITRFPDANPPADRDFAFQIDGQILTAGVSIDPVVINTVEDGSTVDYSVVLNAPPSAGETVTVTPGSGDVTEGTVSGALMFTGANWNIPQFVTVTPGASGDGNDGDVMYTITNAVSSDAPGGCYDGAMAPDVSGTNQNIDGIATIIVDPSVGLVVSEDGVTTASFTVSAPVGMPPTMDVTVDLTPSADVTLDVDPVILTAGNGYSVTVTVTGVADNVVDGDQPFSVTTASSTSGDASYNGVDPVDVSGTILDNNVAEVTVTPSATPLATSETGTTATVDYVLTAQPTADVNFTLNVDDPSEASLDMTMMTFTMGNWNVPQTVTVTGLDDDIDDGTQNYNVISSSTSSSDMAWDGVNVASAAGENADDADTAGFTVNPTSGLITTEAGGTDTFTVELDSEPIFDVSVDFTTSDNTEGLVSSDGSNFFDTITLTFTPANWDTPQTVTVEGQDDAIRDDGDIAYTINSGNVVSGDPVYSTINDAAIDDVSVTNQDDDPAASIIVSPTTLTMDEDGPAMMYTVQLATQPDGPNVSVPVTSGDLTEATVSPATLNFTDANWNVPQQVTVTPVLDFLIDGDITFNVTNGPAAGGTNYDGVSADVSVTVNNIDVCGPMTLDVMIGEPIIAFGTPTCVFDLYKTNGSPDIANWTLLGTFTVGPDGSVDTGVLGEPDCVYVTTITGTDIILTTRPFATVPTLGEWGMIAMIGLLLMAGLVMMKKRREAIV